MTLRQIVWRVLVFSQGTVLLLMRVAYGNWAIIWVGGWGGGGELLKQVDCKYPGKSLGNIHTFSRAARVALTTGVVVILKDLDYYIISR